MGDVYLTQLFNARADH